jgi:hypothetical protein
MNSRDRKKYYPILASRFGEYCRICGEKGDIYTLVVDHIDNNNRNNDIKNLELLCMKCNFWKDFRGKKKTSILSPACVNEYKESFSQTAEMKKNLEAEPFFRRWLFVYLRKEEKIEIKDLYDTGAEVAHCSQDAVKRYTKKICSMIGWAEFVKNDQGVIFVRLKKEWRKESLGESISAIEKESVLQKEGADKIDNSKVLMMNEDAKRIVNG